MIKFIDTGLNQNYNQTKLFRAKLTIEEPKRLHTHLVTLMQSDETKSNLIYDEFKNIIIPQREI